METVEANTRGGHVKALQLLLICAEKQGGAFPKEWRQI